MNKGDIRTRVIAATGCNDIIASKYETILSELFDIDFMGGEVGEHVLRLREIRETALKLSRLVSRGDMRDWIDRYGRVKASYNGVEAEPLPSELIKDACDFLDFIPDLESKILKPHQKKTKGYYIVAMRQRGIVKRDIHKICFEFFDYPTIDAARKDVDRTLTKVGHI